MRFRQALRIFWVIMVLQVFLQGRQVHANSAVLSSSSPSFSPSSKSAEIKPKFLYELNTVVVTARRAPSKSRHSPEQVEIITAEDIERLPARDLTEVLSYSPAIDVQLNGQFGQSTALSLNGSNARQVLLLIDGIPFNTQLSGQANPSAIPVEMIERVEIIKGGASSAWGSSLGGVVNVITKSAGGERVSGQFNSSFAEFGTFQESLSLAGSVKELGYFASGSYYKTDGPQRFGEAEKKSVLTKLSLPIGDLGIIQSTFGYHDAFAQYGLKTASNYSTQPYYARYGQVILSREDGDDVLSVALKFNHQDITTDTKSVSTNASQFETISNNFYRGISLNGHKDFADFGALVMGADFDWHTIKSNRYLSEAKGISAQAPFANYSLEVNGWEFVPGIRYDRNDQFGSQTSPSFASVYRFAQLPETSVRGKISRVFNAPPLMWIYNFDPGFQVGANPDLEAERATVYELGGSTVFGDDFNMDLNFYLSDVRDAIALVQDPITNYYVQRNFSKFRRQGAELTFDYDWSETLSFSASGAFNDVENRQTGRSVRDQGIARQKYSLAAHFHSVTGFSAELLGQYNRWSSEPSLRANDRKPIWDFKLSQAFVDFWANVDGKIFFSIHNLTNSKYWSNIDFPLPRRYFEGGFSLEF